MIVDWHATGDYCSQKQRVTQLLYRLFINTIVLGRLYWRKKATNILERYILRNDLC